MACHKVMPDIPMATEIIHLIALILSRCSGMLGLSVTIRMSVVRDTVKLMRMLFLENMTKLLEVRGKVCGD